MMGRRNMHNRFFAITKVKEILAVLYVQLQTLCKNISNVFGCIVTQFEVPAPDRKLVQFAA